MNKLKSLLVLIVISLFFASSVADARPSFNPKGWFKGKKKGWHGESTPPGLSKKEARQAEKEARKQAKEAEKATEKAAS